MYLDYCVGLYFYGPSLTLFLFVSFHSHNSVNLLQMCKTLEMGEQACMVRPETFESVLDLVLAENKEIEYLLIISDDKKAAKAILHSANAGIKFDNARILTSQHVVRAVANNIKKSTLNFKPSQIDLLSTLLDQVRIQWWCAKF